MPKSLMGGEVDVSAGLAGVNVPSRRRGVSNGGEGPPLEPWCCLRHVTARMRDNFEGRSEGSTSIHNNSDVATRFTTTTF